MEASAEQGVSEAAAEVAATIDRSLAEAEIEMLAEQTHNLPAVRESEAMIARGEVSPAEVVAQRDKIKQVMDAVMRKDVHYGVIPGVAKPTLLKPGAEVLAVTFRLAPSYRSERTFDGDHLTVVSQATLTHIPTGLVVAEGEGLCTSREKKYAYRGEGRTCPACGAAGTIKKSKFAPRESDYPGAKTSDPPGWYCYSKAGGCGANFAASDPAVVEQSAEKVTNPDLPDTWNTVLKMANKRALVAAILNGTAASDIFTQDVEDAGPTAADVHDLGEAEADSGNRAAAPLFGSDRRTGQWIAPNGWAELSSRIKAQLGEDAAAWMEEIAAKAYGVQSVEAVAKGDDQERARDLWQRLNVVLRGLEDADRPIDGPLSFFVGVRQVIQKIIYDAFDGKVAPTGPSWALDPEEAKRLPSRDGNLPAVDSPAVSGSGDAPAAEESPGASEAASAAQDAPGAAAGGLDGIKF